MSTAALVLCLLCTKLYDWRAVKAFSIIRQSPSSLDGHGLNGLHMIRTKPSNPSTIKRKQDADIPHDRSIDRRKSPALWRYDLEYSITSAPFQPSSPPSETNQQSNPAPFLPQRPPELMSPAGGWNELQAAVANGADAVYLGLTSYSARARASNFDPDPTRDSTVEGPASLVHAVRYCHRHRVRVYVAFNTLVFDEELHEVEQLLSQVWDCGVDAVIVQDLGVAKIVKELVDVRMRETGGVGRGLYGSPLQIHASTQQTVTCADGVEFAKQRTNATRVVVGRELSLSEITQISMSTETEIEAFVHGALCVSYSGQCFSSEAWGGRSANRGQCAQACRLPYGLIANGELRHLSFDGIEGIMGGSSDRGGEGDDSKYLLSPQDLCGLDHVEGLVRAGVSCLKIEGRLKDASYVAASTRAYRQAIDSAWNKVKREHGSYHRRENERILSSPEENVSRRDLIHVFARGQDEFHDGLSPGFFEGAKHQRLVRGRSPRHRGVHVGRVVSAHGGTLIVKLDDAYLLTGDDTILKKGDGVVIDRGMPQEEELGGPLYDVKRYDSREGTISLRFGRDVERRWMDNDQSVLQGNAPASYFKGGESRGSSIMMLMAPKGSHVWKTADVEISNRMKRLAALDAPRSRANVFIEGRIGEPLVVKIVDLASGAAGKASSSNLGTLQAADGPGLDMKSLRKAIGTLGNSQWSVVEDDINLSGLEVGSFCPLSWVKDVRRSALLNLEDAFASVANPSIEPITVGHDQRIVDTLLRDINNDSTMPTPTRVRISVLARTYDQVDALCKMMESDNENADMKSLDEIIVDFLEIDGIRAAVSRIKELKGSGVRVSVASPRVIKPGEEGIWRTLLKTEPDAVLIRSTGLLQRLTTLGGCGGRLHTPLSENNRHEGTEVTIPELVGDFSLNAANAITAHEFLQSGLNRITASYDLSASAITELATLLGPKASQLEVVVHQHMPIFHTEHCVFARFLSGGNSYQDCGHVCTRNTIHLRDQNGRDNLVLADMGCRNTVFNSAAQSGVYSINEWKSAGITRLRIELVDESEVDAINIVSAYMKYLSGENTASDVWSILQNIRDCNGRIGGVDVGSLRNAIERRSGERSSNMH